MSKDSVAEHQKFKAKYDIPFALLSDPSGEVCERYGVMREKNMYGKKYMGIHRTTFVIDDKGRITNAYRSVKVDGHIRELLGALSA